MRVTDAQTTCPSDVLKNRPALLSSSARQMLGQRTTPVTVARATLDATQRVWYAMLHEVTMGDHTRQKETTALDPSEIAVFALNVWNYKQGEVVSLMIHLGDRLGLYKALDGAGPVSPAELAERTGLQERWLLETVYGSARRRHPRGDSVSL